MCVKLPPRDLNPGLYPPYPISTYTCEVTITPRVCGSPKNKFLKTENKKCYQT